MKELIKAVKELLKGISLRTGNPEIIKKQLKNLEKIKIKKK